MHENCYSVSTAQVSNESDYNGIWKMAGDNRRVILLGEEGLVRLIGAIISLLAASRVHSFPAKSATLAGRCRPGSVQSLRPGVQMSAQDGSWIPVDLLPTRLRHFWSWPPAIGWPWSSQLPTCETCFVRRTFIAYAGSSNWNSLPAHLRDNSLSLSSFTRHLKTFLFSFY